MRQGGCWLRATTTVSATAQFSALSKTPPLTSQRVRADRRLDAGLGSLLAAGTGGCWAGSSWGRGSRGGRGGGCRSHVGLHRMQHDGPTRRRRPRHWPGRLARHRAGHHGAAGGGVKLRQGEGGHAARGGEGKSGCDCGSGRVFSFGGVDTAAPRLLFWWCAVGGGPLGCEPRGWRVAE